MPFFKPVPRDLRQASRPLHSSSPFGARLGKITPRRVAVVNGEIVDGLPRPSIWRPIVVSAVGVMAGAAAALLSRLLPRDAERLQATTNASSPSASPSPALLSVRSTSTATPTCG